MRKVAANLSLLWPELPFLERFDAAASSGFEAVEVLFPYDIAVRDIQRAMLRTGLSMLLLNAPPPNYTGGIRGFAATIGGQARFQHDMRRAFRYAEALGVKFIHVMTGEGEGQAAFDTVVENLKWASRQAPKGITLTIEPLNRLDAVKKPNVRLQYDSYHAQMIHGDALEIWRRFGLRAAHVQIGDAPGRVPPGSFRLRWLDKC